MDSKTTILIFLCVSTFYSSNITIAIIGTNDIHGTALPSIMQR